MVKKAVNAFLQHHINQIMCWSYCFNVDKMWSNSANVQFARLKYTHSNLTFSRKETGL